MNWKNSGLFLAVFAFASFLALVGPGNSKNAGIGLRAAYADQYQLAASSITVFSVQVATFGWTQVDVPALQGRTNLSVYNLDTSSPIYCRGDNAVTALGVRTDTTQPLGTFPIANSGNTSPNPPSEVDLSLSNFASNRGAYPVSVPMPLYCISARFPTGGVITSTVAVVQSY